MNFDHIIYIVTSTIFLGVTGILFFLSLFGVYIFVRYGRTTIITIPVSIVFVVIFITIFASAFQTLNSLS